MENKDEKSIERIMNLTTSLKQIIDDLMYNLALVENEVKNINVRRS